MAESELSASSTFESRLESVEIAEEMVRRFSHDAGFDDEEEDFIGLAVREIVINAIKHGNRLDPKKKVGMRLSKSGRSLTIEVDDEGDGFRLEDVPDPRASENLDRRSGRGLAIALAIMDEFFVESNVPRGAHIRMVKALPEH